MRPSSMLIFAVLLLIVKPSFSFSLRFPNPNFQPEAGLSFVGDAVYDSAGIYVHLNLPKPSSSGLLLRTVPFECSSSTSFFTNFTFQMGNAIALVIVSTEFPSKFARNSSLDLSNESRFLGVEFEGNVCKIVSARVSNVSKISKVLKSGVELSCLIDYRASLKRLDVRLSKLGDAIPVDPLISYRIDLGEMWKGEKVFLGLASSSGNSKLVTNVYSWRSEIKGVPKWLHSRPVNPEDYSNAYGEVKSVKKKGDCFLSGFIFAMGCGALAALVLSLVWSYVAKKLRIRGEPAVSPVDFKYEKISFVVESLPEAAKK